MLFNAKTLVDKQERAVGLTVRFFGVDFCVMLLGWLDDWMIIDLRAPVNKGFMLQLLFIFIGVGRMPDDSVYRN